MQKDVISDIFSTLRLSGSLYFAAQLRGDFAVEVPAESRRIRFHLVRHGTIRLQVPGADTAILQAGDLALVPNGAAQILSHGEALPPTPLNRLIAAGALT